VGLEVGAERIRIESQGPAAVVAGGEVVARVAAGVALTLTRDGPDVVVAGDRVAGRYGRLSILSLADARFVLVSGKPFRGVIDVYPDDRGLTVVNQLPLESYLAGVVNAEMGRRGADEQAALEAQAIVARTYAIKNLGKFGAQGFDLRATVADQAYGGVAAESDAGQVAVRETAGMVLTHRGEPIATFFHSTCGGSTATPDEAFRTVRAMPYLRPVSDRRRGGYYCEISPRFRWSVEWDGATLARILRRTVPSVLGIDASTVDEVRGIRIHRTGRSGRATEVRLTVRDGEIPIIGPDLRAVLETPEGRILGSTSIVAEVEREAGIVSRLTVRGGGWGHGVGMCQWGAVGRARAGQDSETIVTTYFPGTRLERWY
jgi:stage II sporulation protein D